MTRAQRIAVWNKYAQSGLSLEDAIDRAMAEAEQAGWQKLPRWMGLDESERRRVEELGRG